MPRKPSETSAGIRSAIDGRLSEIASQIGELEGERSRLERARVELDGGKAKRPGRPPKSAAGRPRKASSKSRRARRGTRADQAVKIIEKTPGLGASGIAKKMKIPPNYLYRVLGDLEKEGRVKKEGRKYFPA
jgi:hypothetical protein